MAKHNLVLPLDFTSTCPRIWWKAENILKTRYSKQGKASHLKTNMALQNHLGEMRKAYQLYSVSDPLPCWPDRSQTKACHERARGRLRSAGWPALSQWHCSHEQCSQTELYFSLTTISRNSILTYFSVLPNRPVVCASTFYISPGQSHGERR